MSINKEKVFESFSSFLKSPKELENCKSVEKFLPDEVKLAIQLCFLMNSYNITEEEVWEVYELKENLKIDDLKEAWSIYNEGGIVERDRNSSEDSCFEAYLTVFCIVLSLTITVIIFLILHPFLLFV